MNRWRRCSRSSFVRDSRTRATPSSSKRSLIGGDPPLWLMRGKPNGAGLACQYAIRQARLSLRRSTLPEQTAADNGGYGAAQILHLIWTDGVTACLPGHWHSAGMGSRPRRPLRNSLSRATQGSLSDAIQAGPHVPWIPASAGMTVVQRSPSAGITMALRRPNKGMKVASSAGMVEADPAPGPSLGPRDDIARWPGAIFIAMTVVQRSPFAGTTKVGKLVAAAFLDTVSAPLLPFPRLEPRQRGAGAAHISSVGGPPSVPRQVPRVS